MENRTLRLFFALWPEGQPRRELGRWAAAMHRVCGGRRIPTENLHITLAFLGQVEAERLETVIAVAKTVRPRCFDLCLDDPGYWTHNHIAWLGATEAPAELDVMCGELRGALQDARFVFDPKPFVAHATLVRNARPPKEEWPTLLPVDWPVRGFALISSERDQSGVYYRVAAGPFQAPRRGVGPAR